MGQVPSGTVPVGYVLMDTPIWDSDGNVIWANVLSDPPTDGTPYIPYYGEKFLIQEEYYNKESPLTIDIYKALLECMQHIRYNGPTIASFFKITSMLVMGYIQNIQIVPSGRWCTVYYSLNSDTQLTHLEQRRTSWLTICKTKFKLFYMVEQ
jgi:hypothetical protein